ncbi:MAG: hypothetical protein AAGF11_19415 [Myxococcota bacterium]
MSQVRRALSSLALPLLAAWGLGAACYNEPLLPVFGYENDELSCSDSADNDADCLVDCEDPDCLVLSTVCGEVIPEFPVDVPENPYFCQKVVDPDADGDGEPDRIYAVCTVDLDLCRDRVDNDANGQFDCGDRKCQDVFETGCLREATNELCSDGIDNDQNGFADCRDFGCLRSPLVDVCDEGQRQADGDSDRDGASCVDGVDNDNDGKVDCEDDCDLPCSPTLDELAQLGIVDDPALDGEFCCEFLGVVDFDSCARSVGCGSPEDTLAACSDGDDNDNDGYTDCNDRDCLNSDDPQVVERCDDDMEPTTDMEATIAECTDGVDNDGDGAVDCDDSECMDRPEQALMIHCNGMESSVSQCTDGVDNDDDGFIDCEDFDCSMSPDPEVAGLCEDMGEDMGEGMGGLVEPPSFGGGPENTLEACSDGVDNDGDGFVDCEDFDCSMSPDVEITDYCASIEENTPAACSDGVDNDGNGFTDCEDFGCSMSDDPEVLAVCEEQLEGTPEACSDGIDNDGNGFIDCQDFGCSMSENPAVLEVCEDQLENNPEACSDGVDNDGNGFIDCQDFGCSMSEDPAVLAVCADQLENTPAACSDGIDNDGNGFIDCLDFGCSQSDDFAVLQACQESLALSNAEADQRCSDGLDNDADGFVDCDDFDCSHNPEVSRCPTLPYCETGRPS